MKYLILLADEPRCIVLDFTGHSGRRYRFLWSDTHRAMIYLGREITGFEFDAVARDIFAATADQNCCRPVPQRIEEAVDPEEIKLQPKADKPRQLPKLKPQPAEIEA